MADDRSSQTVSLGCGTLILIALIVLIFGRGGTEQLESEVRALKGDVAQLSTEIGDLKGAVARQSEQLNEIEKAIERLEPGESGE